MNTITVKRASFVSSNYSVFVNGQGPTYATTVKFTLKDPQEIVLNAPSNHPDEAIHMRPVGAKTGYGDRAEYSLHRGNAEPFGYFAIEGRVCPAIRLFDEKHSEFGVVREKSKVYSLIRTLLQKVLPNFYTCRNHAGPIFTASEIYTPLMCRVKLKVNQTSHKWMDEFAICAGLWIACTPSF